MLAGIIKEENNDYYIHINKENNQNILDIIRVDNNSIKHLNKEEIIKLVCELLISKLTFKEKSNGYDIYLDEANNKRYFKNGKEDYQMFLLNNGVNAMLFDENNDAKEVKADQQNDEFETKNFIFKHKNKIITACLSLCLVSLVADGMFLHMQPKNEQTPYEVCYTTNGIINGEKAETLIKNSQLTEEDKIFLCNSDLLQDVMECSTKNENDYLRRNYELTQKMENINIKAYPVGKYDALGYYTAAEPNTIHLCDFLESGTDSYYDVLSHEFIHLLQAYCLYPYICEASAEMMSVEYFNSPNNAYASQVKYLKVLMEIIGSDVIFEYNFTGDKQNLNNTLQKYLNESDYNRIIEIFKTDPNDWKGDETSKSYDMEMEEILSRMYLNKTGEQISSNPVIKELLNSEGFSNSMDRAYFNKRHENYDKNYEYSKKVILDEEISYEGSFLREDIVSYKYYKTKRLTEEEANALVANNILRGRIVYEPIEDVIIINNSDDMTLIFKKGDEIYNQEEAIKNGLIIRKKEIVMCEETTSFQFDKAIESDYFEISFQDGTHARYKKSTTKSAYDNVECYKIETQEYPSMKKISESNKTEQIDSKFSDMFEEHESEIGETQKHI